MGRPTDEVKSHIVKCRIGDMLYDKIKGENMSETIRNALDSFVSHNGNVPRNNVSQNESNVPQNIDDSVVQNDNVKQLQERITELENDNAAKQERIAELEFFNDADYVDQLKAQIDELKSEIAGLKFLAPGYRDEVEKMADMTCGVENFYKSVLEKVEREEMDFNKNGFELTDTEVVEALRNNEIREQLNDMRKGCEEKQVDKVKAMTRALKQGLVKVRGEIWGIRS